MTQHTQSTPVFDSGINGFGAPSHLPGFYSLAHELGYGLSDKDVDELGRPTTTFGLSRGDTDDGRQPRPPTRAFDELGRLLTVAAGRLATAEATGRWRVRYGHREPVQLVPGDVLALSALHAMSLMAGPPPADADGDPMRSQVYVESAPLARTVLEARSYWLPAAAIEAVLTSEEPAPELLDEIRLPSRSCVVWFAQPVLIPGEGVVPDVAGHLAALRQFEAESPPGERNMERVPLAAFEVLDCIRRRPHDCVVEGVMLVADDDGRLTDGAAWLVRVPDDDPGVTNTRAVLFARRSQAAWRSILDVLAAIIAWGDWTMPEQLPTFDALEADRAGRRQLQKGRTRRLEEAGGLAAVVILDARRRSHHSGDAGGTHASPITHVRRGHFKRVPVGPRDEARREVRWINPTIVNPDGAGRDLVRVYRLPVPTR